MYAFYEMTDFNQQQQYNLKQKTRTFTYQLLYSFIAATSGCNIWNLPYSASIGSWQNAKVLVEHKASHNF